MLYPKHNMVILGRLPALMPSLIIMNYKCSICGWEKKQGNYSWNTEDYDEVFKHEQTHKENDRGYPKNRG